MNGQQRAVSPPKDRSAAVAECQQGCNLPPLDGYFMQTTVLKGSFTVRLQTHTHNFSETSHR